MGLSKGRCSSVLAAVLVCFGRVSVGVEAYVAVIAVATFAVETIMYIYINILFLSAWGSPNGAMRRGWNGVSFILVFFFYQLVCFIIWCQCLSSFITSFI